jgi:hypothetical protein
MSLVGLAKMNWRYYFWWWVNDLMKLLRFYFFVIWRQIDTSFICSDKRSTDHYHT